VENESTTHRTHRQQGEEAVEKGLVQLVIKLCHIGEAILGSLDDLFANEEASIARSHVGIRWIDSFAVGRTQS
jgi:hypothetical protein